MARPVIDLTGRQFGRLVVLRRATGAERRPTASRDSQWLCRCLCGERVVRRSGNFREETGLHCGADFCRRHPWLPAPKPPRPGQTRTGQIRPGMVVAASLAGQAFGRLTVVEDSGRRLKGGAVVWRCACSCGGEAYVITANLRSGNTTSCGCLQVERSRAANRREN